jgi:hypothetical protein
MYNKNIKIIGGGFLSNHLFEYLKNNKINCKIIERAKCDLSNNKDIKKLNKYIKKNDIIVFIAAKAPAKNISDYNYNLSLCLNFRIYLYIKLLLVCFGLVFLAVLYVFVYRLSWSLCELSL